MQKLGLDARTESPFYSVEKLDDGNFKVNLFDGSSIIAEKVLCAIGRPPNFAPLKLENCGVLVEKNAIKVDEYSNTNI